MKDTLEPYVTDDGRTIGGEMLDLRNITLRFGGVEAIKDISFNIREGEIRAIIGPNGAGKSSMLNVISGFYKPQEGEVWFDGAKRPAMRPFQVARQGIARTFQNIALFEGMSVLDNVMTGRLNHMKAGMVSQALWLGKAEREEVANREAVERVIDFLEIQHQTGWLSQCKHTVRHRLRQFQRQRYPATLGINNARFGHIDPC